MQHTGKKKNRFHQWVLESFPPGIPTVPKATAYTRGQKGPAITAPPCKDEMEEDLEEIDPSIMGEQLQPARPQPKRRERKRPTPKKGPPCFIPLNKGKGWTKGKGKGQSGEKRGKPKPKPIARPIPDRGTQMGIPKLK